MPSHMSIARRAETVPLWPSIARIVATLAIFVFHYLGLLGLYQHRLSVWALLTFSFLSGYLAQSRGTARLPWAARRYFSVMIPHWLVIGPVLLANEIFQYKQISPLTALVTFFGGNLFLDNPLYVITWYVTFVLLLYGYLLLDSFATGWQRVVLTVAGFLFFAHFGYAEYFLAFSVGLYLSAWAPPRLNLSRSAWMRSTAVGLFEAQQLCYPFFLVHGGVQLGMVKLTGLSPAPLFVTSLLLSVTAAFAVHRVSEPLLKRATGAIVGRPRSNPLDAPSQYSAAQV
jgi:hypothetical protein